MADYRKGHRLVLIHGGVEGPGPVTRLGLWNRFPSIDKLEFTLFILGKLALLSAFVYVLYF